MKRLPPTQCAHSRAAPAIAAVLLALMGCGVSSTSPARVTGGTPIANAGQSTHSPTPPGRDALPTPTHRAAATPTTGHGSNPTPTPTRQAPTPTLTPTPMPLPPTATPAPPSVHEVAGTVTYFGGSIVPASATCPQGEIALGGGWSVPVAGARVFAATLAGNTWSVSAAPIGHTASTIVTAYVECLRNAPGATVTKVAGPFTVPASSFNGGRVSCGGSGLLVGWGMTFGATSALEMTTSVPEIGDSWTMEFVNHGVTDATGSLEAVCLNNVLGNTNREHSAGVSVPLGATGGDQRACTFGYASAGGFQSGSGGGGNIYLLHAAPGGWGVEDYAMSNAVSVNAWALCLYFS